ncbi:hypothetical protein Hamer_G007318 [Homarus americanus]|uniref:Uncharacterized protein n=1 Tax=Homarus americanus TaxID=6706 RepID=A0A8J5MVK8_HOMAM|nr:hypothetical protein Hamer_G007318 [Homarus americanus]
MVRCGETQGQITLTPQPASAITLGSRTALCELDNHFSSFITVFNERTTRLTFQGEAEQDFLRGVMGRSSSDNLANKTCLDPSWGPLNNMVGMEDGDRSRGEVIAKKKQILI